MAEPCGFQNCVRPVVKDYPWQMCDACREHAYEVEDSSRLHDLDDVAAEFGVTL